jgi:hypothetical protein
VRTAITVASVVAPLAVVVLTLPYHGGLWLLLALAGGAACSLVLVELGERSELARPEPDPDARYAEVEMLPAAPRLAPPTRPFNPRR